MIISCIQNFSKLWWCRRYSNRTSSTYFVIRWKEGKEGSCFKYKIFNTIISPFCWVGEEGRRGGGGVILSFSDVSTSLNSVIWPLLWGYFAFCSRYFALWIGYSAFCSRYFALLMCYSAFCSRYFAFWMRNFAFCSRHFAFLNALFCILFGLFCLSMRYFAF